MPVELRPGTSVSTVAKLCASPAELKSAPTPSYCVRKGASLLSLRLRLEAAAQFLRVLARCRARTVPRPLRPATIAAFTSRRADLLACSAARAFGASLLGLSLADTANVDGDQLQLSEVLSSTRFV